MNLEGWATFQCAGDGYCEILWWNMLKCCAFARVLVIAGRGYGDCIASRFVVRVTFDVSPTNLDQSCLFWSWRYTSSSYPCSTSCSSYVIVLLCWC